MESNTPRSSRQLTRFFIPLAIQAASQALSYPLVAMLTSGFILLHSGAQGYVICAVGLSLGSLSSSATMRVVMHRSRPKSTPVAPTTTSVGQIR